VVFEQQWQQVRRASAGVGVLVMVGLTNTTRIESRTPSFAGGVELVIMNVAVMGPDEQYVTDLTKNDFTILDDGIAQPIEFFSAKAAPIDVTLMMDASSSMMSALPLIRAAAAQFLDSLRPGDRASIVRFSKAVEVLQPLTSDRASLELAIQKIALGGTTALHTAVYVALKQQADLSSSNGAEPGGGQAAAQEIRHKALVVLTDGQDTASTVSFDQLLEQAVRSGLNIYPIRMRTWVHAASRKELDAEFNLKQLARETGALAYFPESAAELANVYQAIARDLSSRYSLAFVANHVDQCLTFHRLSVVVEHPRARSVSRAGYYASVEDGGAGTLESGSASHEPGS
jgi:VWFA-related protein